MKSFRNLTQLQTRGGRQGAKPLDSPHPRRGSRACSKGVAKILQILQILKLEGPRPCRRPLPKTNPKSSKSRTLKKHANNYPKVLPKGPQSHPNGSPNSQNSAKSAFQTQATKTCAQSALREASQDPPLPQKLCSRPHGSIVFRFPPVGPKCSQMGSTGIPLGSLWLPKWAQSRLKHTSNKSQKQYDF